MKNSKSKWMGLTLAGLSIFALGNASADFKVESKSGGVKVWQENSPYSFQLGGCFQLDQAMYSGNTRNKGNDFPAGANLRRGRVHVKGGLAQDWTYAFIYDFAARKDKFVQASLSYAGPVGTWTIGHFLPAWGLNNTALVSDLVFLQDASPSAAWAPNYILGLGYDVALNDMLSLQLAAGHPGQNHEFSNSNDPQKGDSFAYSGKSQRTSLSARLAFSPVHTEETAYHIGASVYRQGLAPTHADGNPLGLTEYAFAFQPEVVTRNTNSLISMPRGLVSNSNQPHDGRDRYSYWMNCAGELAAGWGPMNVQGEYFSSKMKRHWSPRGNVNVHGYQVQVAYLLTGETRPYNNTTKTFGKPVSNGECGAWEIALRQSAVNLNSKDVRGGKINGSTTLGLNWYCSDNLRLAANYNHVRWTPANPGTAGTNGYDLSKRRINGIGLRAQFVF